MGSIGRISSSSSNRVQPRKVKGNFIDLLIFFYGRFFMNFPMVKNGPVENIFEPRLKVTDKICIAKYKIVFFANNIAMSLEDHMVECQRSGLVRTENIH